MAQTVLPFPPRNRETAPMSLIHEALQKAEAERRAGDLPALLSITAARQQPQRRGGILLPAVVAAAVLAAAVYVNRDLIRPGADASALVPATAPTPAATRTERAQTPPAAAKGPAPVRSTRAQAPAVDVFSAAQSDAIAAKLGMRAESTALGTVQPRATAVAPTPRGKPLPDPEPELAPAPAEAIPVLSETPPPQIIAVPEPDVAVPAVAVADADQKEITPPPVVAALAATALPMMFELPLATRKALPALKVTMFVYSEDRSRRFAIIDGKRVNENGVMGNDLSLIEIQRDGMVLDFRGSRFLLPRLGR